MDSFLVEDVSGLKPSATTATSTTTTPPPPPSLPSISGSIPAPPVPSGSLLHTIPPTADVCSSWIHPELKRLRTERNGRQTEPARKIQAVEESHDKVRKRLTRFEEHVESKKQQIDSLQRQLQALMEQRAEHEAKLTAAKKLEMMMGDQLTCQKVIQSQWTMTGSSSSNGESLPPSGGGSPVPSPSSATMATTVVESNDPVGDAESIAFRYYSTRTKQTPTAWLETLGAAATPLASLTSRGHHNNAPTAQLDAIRSFLQYVAPTLEMDPTDGFVVSAVTFEAPCIVETGSTVACRNVACHYSHSNFVHYEVLIQHAVGSLARLQSPESLQRHSEPEAICVIAEFVSSVRIQLDRLMSLPANEETEEALLALYLKSVNTMVTNGWYQYVLGDLRNTSQGGVTIPLPLGPAVPAVEDGTKILDGIFEKQYGYVHSNDEKRALEQLAYKCSGLGAKTASEVSSACMKFYEDVPLAIVWRVAIAAHRMEGDHDKALWMVRTALHLFPAESALHMELLDLLLLKAERFDVVRSVLMDSVRVLGNQVQALVLARQRQSLQQTISRTIAFLLASTSTRIAATVGPDHAVQLLDPFLAEPCTLSMISPYALYNLFLLHALYRAIAQQVEPTLSSSPQQQQPSFSVTELLHIAQRVPLGSFSEVLFLIPVDIIRFPAFSGVLKSVFQTQVQQLQQLLTLASDFQMAQKNIDMIRLAMRITQLRLQAEDQTSVMDIFNNLDPDLRSGHAELWCAYVQLLLERDGPRAMRQFFLDLDISDATPCWLVYKFAASASYAPIPTTSLHKTRSFLQHIQHQWKLDSTLISTIVADSSMHTKLKINANNWLSFVLLHCILTSTEDPTSAFAMLRAVPKKLTNPHNEVSVAVCYERLALCLRSTTATFSFDIFADILKEEAQTLAVSWLCAMDYSSRSVITVVHEFLLGVYKQLPSLCPPEALHVLFELRSIVLRVAEQCNAVHPLLRSQTEWRE